MGRFDRKLIRKHLPKKIKCKECHTDDMSRKEFEDGTVIYVCNRCGRERIVKYE